MKYKNLKDLLEYTEREFWRGYNNAKHYKCSLATSFNEDIDSPFYHGYEQYCLDNGIGSYNNDLNNFETKGFPRD